MTTREPWVTLPGRIVGPSLTAAAGGDAEADRQAARLRVRVTSMRRALEAS